jgi:protein gp37
MGYPTDIEWTDATWNPIGGCSIKSPACKNCYAQVIAGTRLTGHPMYAGVTSVVKGKSIFNGRMTIAASDHDVWLWPLKWRGAKRPRMGIGMPSLIFVGDMSDLFHEDRPSSDIRRVTAVCAESKHISQLLTKRPDVMAYHFRRIERIEPLLNVWLGFSAERQQELDERWPHMRALAATGWTIFISIEPMLARVRLPRDFLALRGRAQVIVGGESGADRRETHPDWMRYVRDECLAAGVPYFTKQMTGKRHIPTDLMIRQFPEVRWPVAVAPTPEPQMRMAI